MNAPEQVKLPGTEDGDGKITIINEPPHMIARVSALAVKIVFPFVGKNDIRQYLCGVNLRPLDDGTVMVVASDGRRFVVIRDPEGYAEGPLIVRITKDALKHAGDPTNTLDVMSNGTAIFSDVVAQPLFVQAGNSLIEDDFPKIENVASTLGYREGVSGSIDPAYLADALEIGKHFKGIRFYTRDEDSPLCFACADVLNFECFGGIMKRRDSFESLPAWFPRRTDPTTPADV